MKTIIIKRTLWGGGEDCNKLKYTETEYILSLLVLVNAVFNYLFTIKQHKGYL